MSSNVQRLDPATLHKQLEQAFSEYKEKSEARIQALYNENKMLKAEVAHLKSSENDINKRLDRLESQLSIRYVDGDGKQDVGLPNEGTSGGAIERGGPEGDVKPRVRRTFDVPTDTWLPEISASLFSCGLKQDSEFGSPDYLNELWHALGSTCADSEQFPQLRVPDLDGPDPPRAQPSTVYPPAHEARHPGLFPSSPYHLTRTSFSPVRPASPNEMASHTCPWARDDGMPCGAQITGADLPQHFTSHDVKGFAHDHSLSRRWSGCRLRGDKTSESILLHHVTEKHLGYRPRNRRASN